MELRVINYFLTVAQEGNITRAANILHITQPTLSRQLMDLESELNTTLFTRGKRQITLTEDGILFQQRAKEIIGLVRKTKDEFYNQSCLTGGVISIGLIESKSSRIMMDFIDIFHQRYPDVRFDLYNGYSDDIKEKTDKGIIDLGLLLEPVEFSKYDFFRLNIEEEWGVIMSKNDPLSRREYISTDELIQKPLILPRRANVFNEVTNWLAVPDDSLNIIATNDLLSNSIYLIEKGIAYSVSIADTIAEHNNPEISFIPLSPRRSYKSVIVWRKNCIINTPTRIFLKEFKTYIQSNTF